MKTNTPNNKPSDFENVSRSFINQLRSSNALIVGASRSGIGVANILHKFGIKYALSDLKSYDDLEDSRMRLIDKNAVFFCGEQNDDQLENRNLVIISPGVPLDIPLLQHARDQKIPVISEVEFAFRLIKNCKYIAITGTDGKTTTTMLVNHVCSKIGNSYALGNIGNTFSENILNIRPDDTVVLELSSFQLEAIDAFKPNISAILNIANDHLDRYKSLGEYFAAKKRIYKNQNRQNTLILNYDNMYTYSLMGDSSVADISVETFSARDRAANLYMDRSEEVYYNGENIFSLKGSKLRGMHNKENMLAATLMCLNNGIEPGIIRHALMEFEAAPHRMEFVDSVNGVKYYNDSKATTLQSVAKAVTSFEDGLVLIMAGRNKGIDFSEISGSLKTRAKGVIFTGESRDAFCSMVDFERKHVIKDFAEAVTFAKNLAKTGDVVLLSPGGTSYDAFANYEERGDYFKQLVSDFKKGK